MEENDCASLEDLTELSVCVTGRDVFIQLSELILAQALEPIIVAVLGPSPPLLLPVASIPSADCIDLVCCHASRDLLVDGACLFTVVHRFTDLRIVAPKYFQYLSHMTS